MNTETSTNLLKTNFISQWLFTQFHSLITMC